MSRMTIQCSGKEVSAVSDPELTRREDMMFDYPTPTAVLISQGADLYERETFR